jgi:hypothetical protein
MSSPHLDGGIYTDARMPAVRISWQKGTGRGARLPEKYFAAVAVGDNELDEDLLVSAALTAPQTITVRFISGFTERAKGRTIYFSLLFPDRREGITCWHPGMPDKYHLKVEMTFDEAGTLISSSFMQTVSGGII